MSRARRRLPGLEGWILVLWTALAVGGMTAAILTARGADLDGVRAALRATARTSLVSVREARARRRGAGGPGPPPAALTAR